MTTIIETVFIEKRKWSNFAMDYYLIKSRIIDCYKKLHQVRIKIKNNLLIFSIILKCKRITSHLKFFTKI